jgi:hypothetical protein
MSIARGKGVYLMKMSPKILLMCRLRTTILMLQIILRLVHVGGMWMWMARREGGGVPEIVGEGLS